MLGLTDPAIAAVEDAIGEQVPDSDQDNGPDQSAANRHAEEEEVTDAGDDDDVGHQPDADEGRDDGSDNAEGNPPADDEFGDQANNSRDDEIQNEVHANRPGLIA